MLAFLLASHSYTSYISIYFHSFLSRLADRFTANIFIFFSVYETNFSAARAKSGVIPNHVPMQEQILQPLAKE